MRTSQWFILSILFFSMNTAFVGLDITHGYKPTYDITGDPCLDIKYDYDGIDEFDLDCALRGNVYAPFIHFTYFLSLACLVMGISNIVLKMWDERKKK